MTGRPHTFPSCNACGAEDLEPGFVEDRREGSQGYTRSIAGALARGTLGGARKMGAPRWAIEAWRCGRCQHLELFAREQV